MQARPSADHLYFNATVTNNSDNYISSSFDQTRTEAIVDKADDYSMAVARFELPGHFIPVHIMPIQTGQTDPNLSIYSITLEYNGYTSQQYLVYISTQKYLDTPPSPFNGQAVSEYYFVYEYSQLVDQINTAFDLAHTDLVDNGGAPAGSAAPKFTYSPTTKLFTLAAQVEYYDTDDSTDLITIWMNTKFFYLFQGFFVNDYNGGATGDQPNGQDIQFVIKNFDTPTYNLEYYYIDQKFNSLSNWNPFKRIVFISNGMPIQPEFVPTSNDAYQNILVDFRPDEASNEDVRSIYQYNPYFYRLIPLKGQAPLRRIAFDIYWEDKINTLYPLKIPFNQQMSVKFAFVRKGGQYLL